MILLLRGSGITLLSEETPHFYPFKLRCFTAWGGCVLVSHVRMGVCICRWQMRSWTDTSYSRLINDGVGVKCVLISCLLDLHTAVREVMKSQLRKWVFCFPVRGICFCLIRVAGALWFRPHAVLVMSSWGIRGTCCSETGHSWLSMATAAFFWWLLGLRSFPSIYFSSVCVFLFKAGFLHTAYSWDLTFTHSVHLLVDLDH